MAAAAAATTTTTTTPPVDTVSFMTKVQTNYNKFVNWTDKGTPFINVNRFALNMEKVGEQEADSTLKKVAKVFLALIASVVLFPVALIGNTSLAIKNFFVGTKQNEEAPKAPTGETPAAAQ